MGHRIVFIRSVLNSIPVVLALVRQNPQENPKRHKADHLQVYARSKRQGRIPLISWEAASNPKDLGRWRIKHVFQFSKALTAKGGGKLLMNKGIWQNILFHKYTSSKSIKEWVKVTQHTS